MIKEAPAPKEIVQLLKCGCERTDAHTIGSRDHAKASPSSTYLVRHPRIETDCKRPFFSRFIVQPPSHAGKKSVFLLTPSKNTLHAIQKCRKH